MSFHEGSKWQERQDASKKPMGQLKNNKIVFSHPKMQPKTIAAYLGSFLEANGFEPTGEKDCWANDMCGVVVTETNIEVANNNGDVMYSPDHNIYWLVGMLTWYGYIPFVYKKI